MTQEHVDTIAELLVHLGELRRSFGVHIGALCVSYGIDLPEVFEDLLPGKDDSENSVVAPSQE